MSEKKNGKAVGSVLDETELLEAYKFLIETDERQKTLEAVEKLLDESKHRDTWNVYCVYVDSFKEELQKLKEATKE